MAAMTALMDNETSSQLTACQPAPSVADPIIDAAAHVCGVLRDAILGDSRTAAVARARQLAIYVAREQTGLSLHELAEVFRRDHSTIVSAHRTVREQMPQSAVLRDRVALVMAAVDVAPATMALQVATAAGQAVAVEAAYVGGVWAAHPAIRSDDGIAPVWPWSVSHVPSGAKLRGYETERDAAAMVRLLCAALPSWGAALSFGVVPPALDDVVLTVLRSLIDVVDALGATDEERR